VGTVTGMASSVYVRTGGDVPNGLFSVNLSLPMDAAVSGSLDSGGSVLLETLLYPTPCVFDSVAASAYVIVLVCFLATMVLAFPLVGANSATMPELRISFPVLVFLAYYWRGPESVIQYPRTHDMQL